MKKKRLVDRRLLEVARPDEGASTEPGDMILRFGLVNLPIFCFISPWSAGEGPVPSCIWDWGGVLLLKISRRFKQWT